MAESGGHGPGEDTVVIKHYEKLEHDISEIEAGRVPIRDAYRKRLAKHVKRRGRRVPLWTEEEH